MLVEALVGFALVLLLFLGYRRRKDYARRRGVPYPPGPAAHPIIGHLFKIPRAFEEHRFTEYADKYGDVVYLHTLGKDIVILNNEKCAVELLEKRSINYSSRPSLPVNQMMGWGDSLSILPYGPEFYKARKSVQEALSKKECLIYQDVQLRQSRILLLNLLRNASEFELHLTRFTNAVTTEVIYGHRIVSNDDPYVAMVDELISISNGLGDMGTSIIDVIPVLRHVPYWIPGAWYAKYAKKYRPKAKSLMDGPFEEVQNRISLGTAEPCYLANELETLQNKGPIMEQDLRRLKMAAFQLYMAGGETTSSTLMMFLLVMIHNPHIQKIAQRELDEVLGHKRLPDFEDKDSLPYVTALVNEVFRWKPVVPLGVPHTSMEDDIYNNMFIPKGTMMIPNQRYMLSDPNTYRDPQSFTPERFLPRPDGYGEPLPTSAFGFGRRICPGKQLAEGSIWIAITSILSTFDILPLRDGEGKTVIPSMEFDVHLTVRPKSLPCIIRPRTTQHASLIDS